ncbi:MAG: glycosyltransferase 2 family protein [Actinomycetota bacterium]|nr:glycosyltransferase 2 family protein [Actinomycetota bacterium]
MATRMTTIIRARMRQAIRSSRLRLWIRLGVGVGVFIAVIAHVGTGPLLRGLLGLDGRTIGAALLLAAVATAAAAWRWRLIATRLGVELRWSTAMGMYYRSQFLNTVIPGGVVGDVHRAVAHRQGAESIKQTSRAVAIERTAGQVVQLAVALTVLAWFGAEFEGYLLATIAIGLGMIVVALLVVAGVSVRAREALLHEARELRAGLGSARVSAQVAVASLIVIACHVATFTIATAAVGESVSAGRMLALAFVVLLGASIPLNIGGWGPREGIAGWAFALAGFGAAAGVAASILFGALVIISVIPGAIVMVASSARKGKANYAALAPAPLPVLVLADRSQEKTP